MIIAPSWIHTPHGRNSFLEQMLTYITTSVHYSIATATRNPQSNDDFIATILGLICPTVDYYIFFLLFLSSATERLAQLRPLLQQWKTLDNRLEQLQVDLRGDEKTLHLLDSALQGGALSDQTAIYVRDVAKLLSETTTVQVGSLGCLRGSVFICLKFL